MSRNIFIDTEINQVGNRGEAKIILPTSQFRAHGNDRMRLTLLTFDMRRNWYSINATNNTFYIRSDTADTYNECVIAPGSYLTFLQLAAAIEEALQVHLAAATCVYDDVSRKFTFELIGGESDSYLCSFQVKEGTRPAGVSENGFFNDAHEVLGLVVSRTPAPVQGTSGAGTGPITSVYAGALNTLEAIYLRTNVMAGNYQTYSFERGLPDQNGVVESHIFARISVNNRSAYDEQESFVTYQDANDLFTINLQNSALSNISLYLTDDKGRLLSEISSDQTNNGMMPFKCTIRWDLIAMPQIASWIPTERNITAGVNHVPVL